MKKLLKIIVIIITLTSLNVTAQVKIKVPNLNNDNNSNTKTNKNNSNNKESKNSLYSVQDKVSIEEKGKWYPGYIMEVNGNQYKIHYDGYDAKYDTWVGTERLKSLGGSVTPSSSNTSSSVALTEQFKKGDMVEFTYGGEQIIGEITSELSGAGRYSVQHGTNSTWLYPKELKATNQANANIKRDKLAAQKKTDDEAATKKDKDDQVGVIEGEKYTQFMADADFAIGAVGQLCYYLENPPSQAPGFEPSQLKTTLDALAKLDKIIKDKYPNAKSAKYINRFSAAYSQQPGLFREVAEQRVTLAKKALASSIHQQLRDSKYSFETEFERMKSNYTNSKTIYCAGFMEWAYFPNTYKKYKNDIRIQYEKAYKDAGLEFIDDEVFATLNKQLEQVKQYTNENIGSYSLETFKSTTMIHEKEAEAAALSAFKKDHPEATPVFYGCHSDYVISYDNNWAPPKNLGKGLSISIVSKVAGVPQLVVYSCNIDKAYKGGAYGPAYLNVNGFYFWGLVKQ